MIEYYYPSEARISPGTVAGKQKGFLQFASLTFLSSTIRTRDIKNMKELFMNMTLLPHPFQSTR